MSFTPNAYIGLWEGTIDKKSSSVINAIFDREHDLDMLIGDTVHLAPAGAGELLPRVGFIFNLSEVPLFIGIGVAGDFGGIYPKEGAGFSGTSTEFTIAKDVGQGVRVCTQGRCIARVFPTVDINVGDKLTPSFDGGAALQLATSGDPVVATALQFVAQKLTFVQESYAAVDVQREGILP